MRIVSRHSRNAIAASVNASVTMFDTTDPSVPVSARCAPITSLFMRLMSAPVCVACEERDRHALRVIEQRSTQFEDEALADLRRPPALAERQQRVTERDRHHQQRERRDHAVVLLRDGGVDDALDEQRRQDPDQRLEDDGDEERHAASSGRDGRSPTRGGRAAGRGARLGRSRDPFRACCAGPCDASRGMVSGFCVNPAGLTLPPGGLPEWTKGAASKAVVASGSPWVQIPHPPRRRHRRAHRCPVTTPRKFA